MEEYYVTAEYKTDIGDRVARMYVLALSAHQAENFFINYMVENHDVHGFRDITVMSPKPRMISLSTTPIACTCKGTLIPTHCDIHNKMF